MHRLDRAGGRRYLVSMTSRGQRLIEEALTLSDEERADLATRLLATLEPPVPPDSGSMEAWIAELERRARAAIAGEPGLPWGDVRTLAERRLREQ